MGPLITVPTGAEEDKMITITLKDGSKREVEKGKSVIDVAKQISEGLARVAMAGLVDGKVVDLRYNLEKDCKLEILTFDDEDGKKAYWHTTSHIMAQAIKRLFGNKNVQLAIGPRSGCGNSHIIYRGIAV